jgi:hypothetical protein
MPHHGRRRIAQNQRRNHQKSSVFDANRRPIVTLRARSKSVQRALGDFRDDRPTRVSRRALQPDEIGTHAWFEPKPTSMRPAALRSCGADRSQHRRRLAHCHEWASRSGGRGNSFWSIQVRAWHFFVESHSSLPLQSSRPERTSDPQAAAGKRHAAVCFVEPNPGRLDHLTRLGLPAIAKRCPSPTAVPFRSPCGALAAEF